MTAPNRPAFLVWTGSSLLDCCNSAALTGRIQPGPGATGRSGSRIHSLHEPTYTRGSTYPASMPDKARWHAVTPDPHITTHGFDLSIPNTPRHSATNCSRDFQVPLSSTLRVNGRFVAPGICPATGSIGSISPSNLCASRASIRRSSRTLSRASINSCVVMTNSSRGCAR